MKITDLKCAVIGQNPVVRITTDEGISGLGEVESFKPYLKSHILFYRDHILGADPTDVERVMLKIRRLGAFKPWGSSVSAIEMALWDIAGKAAGLPCWALLGGRVRQKIRVYQSIGGSNAQEAGENAQRLIEEHGYTAVKMSPHNRGDNQMPYNMVTRIAGQRVGAVRESCLHHDRNQRKKPELAVSWQTNRRMCAA